MRPALVIDWPKILDEIAYLAGDPVPTNPITRIPLGQRLLAAYLHQDRDTVRRWMDGARVEYHDGEALLEVWCKVTGKAQAFAPRTRPSLSASKV